jgi:CBS domain-containing protein
MITDRDIVRAIAEGKDPAQTTVGELAQGVPVMVSVDDSVEVVVQEMADNQVRRVPVLDADRKLVGIVSQADVATGTSPAEVATMVEAISTG